MLLEINECMQKIRLNFDLQQLGNPLIWSLVLIKWLRSVADTNSNR